MMDDKKLRVVLADSRRVESELIAGELRRYEVEVFLCEPDPEPLLYCLERQEADVLIASCIGIGSGIPGLSVLRSVHLANPTVPKIALLDMDTPELVVQAFRCGARGLFCLNDSSLTQFLECIRDIASGEIWATGRQFGYLLDSVCQVPTLGVVGTSGEKLLTSREEQVVALVSGGLSNRGVAAELGLSEHTVKKYLFRIFEKLGISNRVELVLYAVHHGSPTQPESVGQDENQVLWPKRLTSQPN